MSEYIKLDDTIYFSTITHDPSGLNGLQNADELPKWFIFENDSDTVIQTGDFAQRVGMDGTYRASITASGSWIFTEGNYYEIHASGEVNNVPSRTIVKEFVLGDIYDVNIVQISGIPASIDNENVLYSGVADAVWDELQNDHVVAGSFGEVNQSLYYADIHYVKDAETSQDEFGVCWFKNSSIIGSGDITNPAISAYNTLDGSSYFENQTLDYATVSLGILRYDKTTSLIPSGEPFLIMTSGTIDSISRTWKKIVGISTID